MLSVRLCQRGDVFVTEHREDGSLVIIASPYRHDEDAKRNYNQRGVNFLLRDGLSVTSIFDILKTIAYDDDEYRSHVRTGTYKNQLIWMRKEIYDVAGSRR